MSLKLLILELDKMYTCLSSQVAETSSLLVTTAGRLLEWQAFIRNYLSKKRKEKVALVHQEVFPLLHGRCNHKEANTE